MINFLASLILLVITIFMISLFPGGKDLIADITNTFSLKKANVVEEYEKVKGEVNAVTNTVNEVTEKVEKTVKTVNEAVETTSETLGKVN